MVSNTSEEGITFQLDLPMLCVQCEDMGLMRVHGPAPCHYIEVLISQFYKFLSYNLIIVVMANYAQH